MGSVRNIAHLSFISFTCTCTSVPKGDDCELTLDYGDDNKLGEPLVLNLEISNPTAIYTSYEAHVSWFPASKPPTPPAQPMPGTSIVYAAYSTIITCTYM